jgi:hypothetical protein
MKIPKTTIEKPYIEFKFNKKGNISLDISSSWWGGKECKFRSTDGYEGNTCYPSELESYVKYYKTKRIKDIEREIKLLKNKINILKKENSFV